MPDLVLTGWSGVEFAEIAAHTLPILKRYAERHGLSFQCANLSGERPPSWMKIPAIWHAMETHDRVVWIDCDVVVLDPCVNVFDDLGDAWQGLVEHETECGTVPNCGVWVVTQHMRPVLAEMWESGQDIHHPWWEQAALLRRMGYSVDNSPRAALDKGTTLYSNTAFLKPEWNHHPHDRRRVSSPRFVHVTQYGNRLNAIKQFAKDASDRRSPSLPD
jgi:hypothetical protein